MKRINLIIIAMLFSCIAFSQWDMGGNPLNRFGATKYGPLNNNFRSIGIGHKQSSLVDGWTIANPPRAALHVNDFYLDDPPSWVFTPGQVFRTDGPSNRDNMWQMFTGNNYGNSTEKARLFVPANTNDFVVQASEIFGTIRFNLGAIQRMILRDGLGQVHVGIGNNFSDPQHMIHVHTTPLIVGFPTPDAMIGFTHNLTGAATTDGFLVGINSDGTAELRQQEDFPIRIFTNEGVNNNQRMIISHDAASNVPRVGIGTETLLEPRTFLHIGQDIDVNGNGYRTWMNIGELVVNDQNDNMYFGFPNREIGISDHIINWGSKNSIDENNRLRFINTTGDPAVTSGSTQGLEVARMVVVGDVIEEGRMGIGDFYNLGEDPTQTLDVDGNARLRDLPVNFHDETLTRCVVVDDDGVLHWRNFTGGGPGTTLGNDTQGFVGIGTNNPTSALEVANGDIAVTAD
ncbi:MAG TPA: hypothetical protein PKN32_06965, partial [Bacteroidales bacterium]|nr:hypothetical protein [Bacteroidales bacterium]